MGNTTRREPVSFRIPASPDYKFFNVTDFRGLEMTDNPFIANNNTASDLLNVYVDENNALTTRPRLEKLYDIHNNIENFKEVLFSYKLLDRVVFQVLTEDSVVKLYYKRGNNLTLIDNITNNITIPDTKIAVFEKNDKIYIMTGTLYCVMKDDNILYNVENDVDTYVPTIGVSTINDSGIRTLVDLEQKNILSNKYRIDYYWDTKSDIYDFVDSSGEIIKNGYVTRTQNFSDSGYEPNDLSYYILDDDSILVQYGNRYFEIIKDGEQTESFNISYDVLSVSSNGEWLLCNNGSTFYVVNRKNEIHSTLTASGYTTINSINNKYYISSNGDYVIAILKEASSDDLHNWSIFSWHFSEKTVYKNTESNRHAICISLYTNDYMRDAVLFDESWWYNGVKGTNLGIIRNIYSGGSLTAEWLEWKGLHQQDVSRHRLGKWYIPAAISNDCSVIISNNKTSVFIGKLISDTSSSFTFYTKYMDFTKKDYNIEAIYLSSDSKYVYVIPGHRVKGSDYYPHSSYVGYSVDNIWIYSLNDDNYYKLIGLDKNPENHTYDNISYDIFLGFSRDSSSLFLLSDFGGYVDDATNVTKGNKYYYKYSFIKSKEPLLTIEYSDFTTELPEQNKEVRYRNNFWFYGNGNKIRWTSDNNPTYLPEYNYTTLGDAYDDIKDMLLISHETAVAFKQNNFYVINPTTVSDSVETYLFTEAKSDIGSIGSQSSIISPLKETPLYVNAKGIYGLELLKNVQSSDNVSVLYSENVNKKYLKEVNKFHIMSTSRLYWVLFIIPGKTSKVYVYDDRNSSWYYWELPINTAGCWSDEDTVYFVSKDGRVCDLKTNDIVDTKYSIETEYYDDGRKLIPWFWKSQILPLGTMNYSKKLINTTFILTDTDENEEYGLEYKFKAYRKIVSETNATRVSNRLTYIQSTTKKTTIPRFNFLQIELNNIEDDLNNNKLRLIGLGLKYELLEGLS